MKRRERILRSLYKSAIALSFGLAIGLGTASGFGHPKLQLPMGLLTGLGLYLIAGFPTAVVTIGLTVIFKKKGEAEGRPPDLMEVASPIILSTVFWPVLGALVWRLLRSPNSGPPDHRQRWVDGLRQLITTIKSWRPSWLQIEPVHALRRT